MRNSVEADAKEVRVGFTEAVNAAAKEAVLKFRAESDLYRRRDDKEVTSVAKEDDFRRRDQEEE